jgi:hypothetical protein
MAIDVLVKGAAVPIEKAVFTTLLDNSVAGTYADYDHALESGTIELSKVEFLCEKGDIPFPLFFAPLARLGAIDFALNYATFSRGERLVGIPTGCGNPIERHAGLKDGHYNYCGLTLQ